MNVELDRKSFASALAILAKAVPKKTRPEWKAVHFSLAGHTLTARAGDGENYVSADLEALSVGSSEYPVALVAIADLRGALKKVNQESIILKTGEADLERDRPVQCAYIVGDGWGNAFLCESFNPEDGYPFPDPSGTAGVTLNLGEFIEGIDSLLPFAEKSELRQYIHGVRLSVSKKKSRMLATDQFRFVMSKIPKAAVACIEGDPSITIPPHTCEILSEIGKLLLPLYAKTGEVKIRVNPAGDSIKTNEYNAQASFEIGCFTVITNYAYSGKYPSYEKQLPDLQDCFGIAFPVDGLRNRLQLAECRTETKQPRVTIRFDGVSDAELRFDDAAHENGPTLREAWIPYDELRLPKGESRMDDISVNPVFLAEALDQGRVAGDVQIHFNCGQSPALIRFPGHPGCWHLLMPMHAPNVYSNPPGWWMGRRVRVRLDWPDDSAYGIVKSVDAQAGEATICTTVGKERTYPLTRLSVAKRSDYRDYYEAGRGMREARERAGVVPANGPMALAGER